MNSFSFSAFVLIVWLQIALGNDKEELRFEHRTKLTAIKENHKIGKTSIFVKATGCHGKKATYHVEETQVPFEVDAMSGRILLTKKLNYDESKLYHFTVEAVANDGKCNASIDIQIDVLNVDKNRPYFNKRVTKYHCLIHEETGVVKVWPNIFVKDDDHGDSGKVKKVNVRESDEPFFAKLKQTSHGLKVVIKSLAGYKFDAVRMPSYSFSLQAWDGGDPPRNSPPIKMNCKVVPKKKKAHNKHAPVFVEKEYIGKVTEGEKKSNIVQVQATDKDTGKVFGKVCEYFIRTSDIPFRIDNQGVLSLDKPLTEDAPDNYVFVVLAKDCGGKISDEGAMVNVIVDKDCIPAFVDPEEKSPRLKGCDGILHLTPKVRLNSCGESREYADYTASVTMETAHILKGCDRETYEASGIFKMCNVNKTIDLLPSGKQGHPWMSAILTEDDEIEGENMYQFNGKRVIDVPPYVVNYDSQGKKTISTWIWMKPQDKKQFIIAATDPQRLDRKHFALYTESNKLIFIHRQEKSSGSVVCKSQFTWKPKIFDVKWHHLVITVNGCNAARLFVDSEEVHTIHTKSAWPLHGSTMGKKIVVGAQWLGREQKFDDYFNGYLAGLSINTEEVVNEEAINCVFQCKEKIKIDIPAPDGFHIKQKSHDVIEISGRGRPEAFENLLRGLVYVNTRRSPTIGRRPLQIHATINKKQLPMISMDVIVEADEHPKLELSGIQYNKINIADLKKYGLPVAKKLKISAGKCMKYLDFAKVEIDPVLTADELLLNPGPLLSVYNLEKSNLPDGKGLTIRGLATIEQYERLLQQAVFVHLAPKGNIHHTFKFSVSDLNKRFISNVLNVTLSSTKFGQRFDMQALSHHEKDALPGAVRDRTEHSGSSLGVSIGVIIACSCLFVFIVLVVTIRLRSGEANIAYTDVPQNEILEVTADTKTVMNVTMNPLEKLEGFQEANKEESKVVAKNKNDKMNLEWDDAYIA